MRYATNYAEFEKGTLYNKVPMFDYVADGYLDGLEVVHTDDYSELCQKYRDVSGTLFIADPPYLSIDVKTYTDVQRWTMKTYLDVNLPIIDEQKLFSNHQEWFCQRSKFVGI